MASAAEERVQALFKKADANGDGRLNKDEFRAILQLLDHLAWKDANVDKLFEAVDLNKSGFVEAHQLIHWILGDTEDDQAVSDGDSSSSSSDAESDNDEAGVATRELIVREKSAHSMRSIKRAEAHEEPPTTVQELYELLTMRGGRVEGKLQMDDLLDYFHDMRLDGLDVNLPRCVPQSLEIEGKEPEDLSVLEVGHLCEMLIKQPDSSLEDAFLIINTEKAQCRDVDMSTFRFRARSITDAGINPNAPIGFATFDRLLRLVSATMQIDMEHLISVFVWVRTTRFEMTETMAIELMRRAFLKAAAGGSHILATPVSENDFMRLAHTVRIVDSTEKQGIAHGKLAILFGNITKQLPALRTAREQKRYTDRGALVKKEASDAEAYS
jgi:hypothetical protein